MISLLVVNYRSAALAAEAIASARRACSSPLEVVVIDNSCDPDEAAALAPAADELIVSSANLGYAGAINAGRARCRGDVIVISNPDVVFATDAIDQLAAALRPPVAVAGPALFWDSGHRWHLPPGDLMTGWAKADEVLASRSAEWARMRDRRRLVARMRFWEATETQRVRMLSGAVMAVRRADLNDLGGFDERFRLYFEETDFLRRVAARRKSIVYVPRARCRHIYNQSAGREAAAASLYAESEIRYLEKWNGPFAARLLKRLERPPLASPATPIARDAAIEVPGDLVVEVSPLPSFATAAGHFPSGATVRVPFDVTSAFHGEALYLRVVTRAGEVVATYVQRRD